MFRPVRLYVQVFFIVFAASLSKDIRSLCTQVIDAFQCRSRTRLRSLPFSIMSTLLWPPYCMFAVNEVRGVYGVFYVL